MQNKYIVSLYEYTFCYAEELLSLHKENVASTVIENVLPSMTPLHLASCYPHLSSTTHSRQTLQEETSSQPLKLKLRLLMLLGVLCWLQALLASHMTEVL